MLAHQDDLARLMVAQQGKPVAETKGEDVYAAAFLECLLWERGGSPAVF
jgi:succinate-semialdehyde dehydrogenase/glutarate-semialdehyde dehydrogenase